MGGSTKKKQKGKQKSKQSKSKQSPGPKVEHKGRFRYVCLEDELTTKELRIVTVCNSFPTCFRRAHVNGEALRSVLAHGMALRVTALACRWLQMETASSGLFQTSSQYVLSLLAPCCVAWHLPPPGPSDPTRSLFAIGTVLCGCTWNAVQGGQLDGPVSSNPQFAGQ